MADIFSNWEIDSDGGEDEVPFCAPEDFQATDHSKSWFIHDQNSHKAFHAYHIGDYNQAYELFNVILEKGGHNRVHLCSIYESILRSALKAEKSPQDTLEKLLSEYKAMATAYGDQMQYWKTAAAVLRRIPGREKDYLKTVIMLCLTVDSPDHWLLFGDYPGFKVGPNFELAYLTRAMALLDYNSDFAFGFVAELLKKQKEQLRERFNQLQEPQDRISLASVQMVTDLLSCGKLRELGDDVQRPPHDCRCKVGVYKTEEECEGLTKEFLSRFHWMFDGMQL